MDTKVSFANLKKESLVHQPDVYETTTVSEVETALPPSPEFVPAQQIQSDPTLTQLHIPHQHSSYSSQELQILDGQSFQYKLWYMVNNNTFQDVICWSDNGRAIVFPSEQRFVQKVLKRTDEKIFKTENMKSFVRQLNLYGFHKISIAKRTDNDVKVLAGRFAEAVFEHEYFIRDSPHLLDKVKRRCNVKKTTNDLTPPGQFGLLFPDGDRRRRQTDGLYYDREMKRRLQFGEKEGLFRGVAPTFMTPNYMLRPDQTGFPTLHYTSAIPATTQSVSTASSSVVTIPTIGNVFSMGDTAHSHLSLPPLGTTYPVPFQYFPATQALGGYGKDAIANKDTILSPFNLSPTSLPHVNITSSSQMTPGNFNLGGDLTSSVTTPTSKVFTTLSPLSVLCASLFSPFCETPFNISSDQNGQALSLLAEQASLLQNN